MAIDEPAILFGAALAGALPYALTALVEWSRQATLVHRRGTLHRSGAGERLVN